MTGSEEIGSIRKELFSRACESIDQASDGGSLWDLGRAVGLCDAMNLLDAVRLKSDCSPLGHSTNRGDEE